MKILTLTQAFYRNFDRFLSDSSCTTGDWKSASYTGSAYAMKVACHII